VTRWNLSLALLVAVVLSGSACGSSEPAATGSTPATVTGALTVAAAASLTTPFTTIGNDFRNANPGVTDVTFSFDSSSRLATQIQNGAPADIYASADDTDIKKLTDADLILGPPVRFARNQLTIVVKKGNPKGVKTLADLATVGTVSLCGRDVPCGRYADQILEAGTVTIPGQRITRGQNAKATFTAVSEGDADAGIVYLTDVTGDRAEAVAIPPAQNAIANYPIAIVKASTNPTAAQAFMAYVQSPPGQATLEAAGFLPPA
jgi:molybdate transport system substrate-binding protein